MLQNMNSNYMYKILISFCINDFFQLKKYIIAEILILIFKYINYFLPVVEKHSNIK